MSKRISQLAPRSPVQSIQDILDRLHNMLETSFSITTLNTFNVFVEGWSDVKYLERAVELARNHLREELLAATDNYGAQTEIALLTVGSPRDPSRGGADRLADLAEQIKSYQDVLESFFVFFIFDHDEQGVNACNRVRTSGYRTGQHTTTLNPQKPLEKANYSVKHEKVIEDLLSLEIQQKFFDNCPNRTCKVTYKDGKITRFQ